MTAGLVFTSLLLGIRHGIDWDHIAAISDLSSSASSRRRGFLLSFLYASGHALVVLTLGTAAVVFGARLPTGADSVMGWFVGLSLVAMGAWVLVDLVRKGRAFRLRSRWTLMQRGTAAGVRRARYAPVAPHQHGQDDLMVEEREIPTRNGTAAGIGVVHGIGFESPTQIAVFVASTSVGGTLAGVGLLVTWIIGLVVANSALAGLAAVGLLHAERNFGLYASVAVCVGVASVMVGVLTMVETGA